MVRCECRTKHFNNYLATLPGHEEVECGTFAKKMNARIKWMIGMALVFIVTAIIAYEVGYHNGKQRTIGIFRGTLVAELTALQDIQTNNVPEATRRIESHCYSTAVILLESPRWKKYSAIRMFMPELVAYRERHALDKTKWTPTEQLLEGLLKKEGFRK